MLKIEEFEKVAAELKLESLDKLKEDFLSGVSKIDKTAESFNDDIAKMIGALCLSAFNQNQQYTVELFKRVLEFEK